MGDIKEEMQKVRDLFKANESSPRNESVIEKAGRSVRVTKRRILSGLPERKRKKGKRSPPQQNNNQKQDRSPNDPRKVDKRQPAVQPSDSSTQSADKNAPDRLHASIESRSFHPILPGESIGEIIDFKMPNWNKSGIALSPPNAREGGRALLIRIGLDFGTAYTKVSIQVGEYFFFVDWHGLVGFSTYVLSGHLSLTDGNYRVGRHRAAEEVYRDLKLPLLSGDYDSMERLVPATIFLALVLKYCRAWLYQQDDFLNLATDRHVLWELNTGCPTGSFENNQLVGVYKQISATAWCLSMERVVSWRETRDRLSNTPPPPTNIGLEELSVIPEFVAQIAGYMKSPQRRDDLHFLMDVGAGTLDLASFIVGKDSKTDESVYPILAPKVAPYGTHYLMERRANRARVTKAPWLDSQPVPSIETLSHRWNTDLSILKDTDDDFRREVRALVGEIIEHTKNHRYRQSKNWEDGVPTFLAGGGASVPVYQEALRNAFTAFKIPLIPIEQRAAEDLRSINSAISIDFSRLTVAYGLAIDPAISGKIQPASVIADEAPKETRKPSSHEEYYS